MIMYGVYRFFPVFPLSIICGTVESTFQHLKAAFFAYLILTGVEYLAFRTRIADRVAFMYARLQAALFMPWLIVLVWYIAPATVGQLPIPLEIVWANISVLLVAFTVLVFERSWETSTYSSALKRLIGVLLLLSLLLYVRFTSGPLPEGGFSVKAQLPLTVIQ